MIWDPGTLLFAGLFSYLLFSSHARTYLERTRCASLIPGPQFPPRSSPIFPFPYSLIPGAADQFFFSLLFVHPSLFVFASSTCFTACPSIGTVFPVPLLVGRNCDGPAGLRSLARISPRQNFAYPQLVSKVISSLTTRHFPPIGVCSFPPAGPRPPLTFLQFFRPDRFPRDL